MDPEVMAAWYSTPPRRRHPEFFDRQPDLFDISPAAKRLRDLLVDVDANSEHEMPSADERDLGRGPRRKDSKGSDHGDMFASDDANADTPAHNSDLQATPRPQQPVPPVPMSSTATLKESDRQPLVLASRGQSSRTSSRMRSTSPVKDPDDLLKLEKPVSWMNPNPRALRAMVRATESLQAVRLYNDIWSVIQGEGYLPRELKHILKEELRVDDSGFATDDRDVVMDEKETDDARQLFPALYFDKGRMPGLLALHGEIKSIRDIVATTIRFLNTPRSEATWNDHVHGPVLRLALSGALHVDAENITQASIDKAFVPAARGELETLGGKMIDYAMLLRPEGRLAARISDFVDGFDEPRTFNQSTHGVLCYEPTGVLVKTKADIHRCAEGKAQLGVWLAAWYERVARFPPLFPVDTGTPKKLPFLPVLLVVCENWELYFAFDRDDEIEVHGPLQIGSTMTVDGSYRLLKALRLLAGWVTGEFRGWVEQCVG